MKARFTLSPLAACAILAGCGPGVGGNAGPQLNAAAYYVDTGPTMEETPFPVTAPASGPFSLSGYGSRALDTARLAGARNHYYVSPTGSDSAAGTEAAPFATLARAASAVQEPGTTVWVAPGTYAGGIQTTASGSAAERVTYISTTRWGARIVSGNAADTVAWDNRGDRVSIIGFDIDGSAGGAWSHGIYTGGSYSVIQDNRVHHIARNTGCSRGGGSAIGADSYFHGVEQDVLANTVHDIGPANCKYIQGIYMSTSGRVVNNLVYRVGEAAIHLWHDATHVTVANNTVAGSRFGIIIGGGDFYFTSGGNDHTSAFNNLVYDNGVGIAEQGKTGASNRYMNNLVARNSVGISLRNGLSAIATVSSDPLLSDYSSSTAPSGFRLSSSSPAIGRGVAADAPARDIDGNARDGAIDIGAYTY